MIDAEVRPRITARRGTELRCRGWRQETILRLLENNLEVGERPQDLVIYAGSAKAARDWDAYHLTVDLLKTLDEDQTLVMQSGKPVGVFPTQATSPLVVMAAGNVVGTVFGEPEYQHAVDQGLVIFPGMTAGAWQYIGSQGIVQGTYETFMACAREHFDGSLAGRRILTAGSGGMGGAQGLAGVLAGAATLLVDVHRGRLERRVSEGYVDLVAADLESALALWDEAAEVGEGRSVGVVANAVDVHERLLADGRIPDVVTDQTTTDPRAYYPVGYTSDEAEQLRDRDLRGYEEEALATLGRHVEAMLAFQEAGAIVFEYGNGLRAMGERAGVRDATTRIEQFTKRFIRPMFCEAIGPFRWIAVTGEQNDIKTIDETLLKMFADVPRVTSWLGKARRIHFTGLPARTCWLGHTERTRAAVRVNEMVASGELSGPIAFTRDHLDAGSASIPFRETEGMIDGSDAVSDWAFLNALLNGAAGADLIAIHSSCHAGMTVIADGSENASHRLRRVLDADTGMGIIRYADAGYERAVQARERHNLSPVNSTRRMTT